MFTLCAVGHHGHHHASDDPGDEQICVCFHVQRRKVEAFCRRTRPVVASLISNCLNAGSGCGWCIPYLKAIHKEIVDGGEAAVLPEREEYLRWRKAYHQERGIKRE